MPTHSRNRHRPRQLTSVWAREARRWFGDRCVTGGQVVDGQALRVGKPAAVLCLGVVAVVDGGARWRRAGTRRLPRPAVREHVSSQQAVGGAVDGFWFSNRSTRLRRPW